MDQASMAVLSPNAWRLNA